MGLFRDHILRSPLEVGATDTVLSILNAIILDQIQMDREGDVIDKNRIRSCIYMLEGLYETDKEEEADKLYLTSFEDDFLRASRDFYRAEGESLLRQMDAGAYLRHTTSRLREEMDRCRSSISPLTASKIAAVVEDELIRENMREVAEMEGSGIRFMLDNDRYDDLKLFYQLNGRVDPAKIELTRPLQKRVIDLGADINKSALASTIVRVPPPAGGPDETEDMPSAKGPTPNAANLPSIAAIQWVDDVLRVKDKYDRIWELSFDADQTLQTALTKSFSDFINSFPRSSEYISLFIDDNLKRGLKGKTENEVDAVLDKAIVLLRYVQDKDLFERYYKKHLARRLLLGKSISTDVERQMISRMKLEVGNHFTQKLEGMFKDITISGELTTGFKRYVSQLDGARIVELGVHVLTSTFWPLEAMGPTVGEDEGKATCIFPAEIARTNTAFEKFYHSKHNGRQLSWPANLGTADIRVTFPRIPGRDGALGKERKHEINVSTYAMVILHLFNELSSGESLSFAEIQARTLIPENELVRNLQSLAVAPKTRILIKDPMSKEVRPTDGFRFNEGFVSKFLRIKVGVVSGGNRVEADKERRATESKNDEMRKGVIEAAIVRIMKYVHLLSLPPHSSTPVTSESWPISLRKPKLIIRRKRQRKELSHLQLYTEVITQLAGRFRPDLNMVKSRVEGLIEREYLERIDDAKRPAYRYLA